MNRTAILQFVPGLALPFLVCCFGPFNIYSPSQIHRTIQREGPGEFRVSYRWRAVEQEFGKDEATALAAYMRARGIMPSECASGIVILKGYHLEGGGAWSVFRCKDADS